MSFRDLVVKARSIRRFVRSDPIPPALVRDLVDLVRLVPSGGNRQPLKYRIVTEPAECDAVFAHLRWAAALKDWAGPSSTQRPTAYIAILAQAGKNPEIDLGIVGQTLQLAATDAGYGACMLGNFDRAAVHQLLKVPAQLEILLIVALGRPGEKVVLEDIPSDGNVAYWRTPDGVHHVPKRKLGDVLL
jgi:nitroreductase